MSNLPPDPVGDLHAQHDHDHWAIKRHVLAMVTARLAERTNDDDEADDLSALLAAIPAADVLCYITEAIDTIITILAGHATERNEWTIEDLDTMTPHDFTAATIAEWQTFAQHFGEFIAEHEGTDHDH